MLFPFLRYYFPSVDFVAESSKKFKAVRHFLQNVIDKHRNNFDEDNIRDFIDAYIQEIQVNNAFFKMQKHVEKISEHSVSVY
jgi:hypothetical protein